MVDLRKRLISKYTEILKDANPLLTFSELRSTSDYTGFSNLFLPDVPREWTPGKRVLVVGRETRGWKPENPINPADGLHCCIQKLMKMHEKHFNNMMARRGERGMRFFNFVRNVAAITGKGNVAWSNIFALDWKNGIPTEAKTPHYSALKELSEKLLKAQIEVLEPDVIVFACGDAGNIVRREFFPTKGENAVCFDGRTFEHTPNKYLWSFKLYGKIQCFRLGHPSSRGEAHQAARKKVLLEIQSYLNTSHFSFGAQEVIPTEC